MFENIGGKLKILAVVEVILGVLGSVICGLSAIVNEMVLTGIIIMVVGGVSSWMGSWMAYGIGEAVENSEAILRRLRQSESVQNPACAPKTAPKVAGPDEWKCECGRVNKNYVTTCPCGKNRYQ